MALKYLTATVTQGSNDAFAETEIPTGLAAVGNVAFRIRELVSEIPSLAATNAVEIEVALTRKTFAAMPSVTERTLLYKRKIRVSLTTSGTFLEECVDRVKYDADDNLLIVEDPIYLSVDSNATSASNSVRIRIGYEQIRISEVDRLQLIAQTLTDA